MSTRRLVNLFVLVAAPVLEIDDEILAFVEEDFEAPEPAPNCK